MALGSTWSPNRRETTTEILAWHRQSCKIGKLRFFLRFSWGCCRTKMWQLPSVMGVAGSPSQMHALDTGRWHLAHTSLFFWRFGSWRGLVIETSCAVCNMVASLTPVLVVDVASPKKWSSLLSFGQHSKVVKVVQLYNTPRSFLAHAFLFRNLRIWNPEILVYIQ